MIMITIAHCPLCAKHWKHGAKHIACTVSSIFIATLWRWFSSFHHWIDEEPEAQRGTWLISDRADIWIQLSPPRAPKLNNVIMLTTQMLQILKQVSGLIWGEKYKLCL